MKTCPDTEQLAAYLKQQLSIEESEQMELHFLDCRICRKIVARVVKSESVVPEPIFPNRLHS